MGVMVEVTVKDAAVKVKRAGVQGGISTEAGGCKSEAGSLIDPALPEHSRRTMKVQQMLTGRGLHWLFQRVRGGSFRG